MFCEEFGIRASADSPDSSFSILPILIKKGDEITIKVSDNGIVKHQNGNFPIRSLNQTSRLSYGNLTCEFNSSSAAKNVYLAKDSVWKGNSEFSEGALILKKQGSKTQIYLSCFQVSESDIYDGPAYEENTERCTKRGGIVDAIAHPQKMGRCKFQKPTLDELKKLLTFYGFETTLKSMSVGKVPTRSPAPIKEAEVLGAQ